MLLPSSINFSLLCCIEKKSPANLKPNKLKFESLVTPNIVGAAECLVSAPVEASLRAFWWSNLSLGQSLSPKTPNNRSMESVQRQVDGQCLQGLQKMNQPTRCWKMQVLNPWEEKNAGMLLENCCLCIPGTETPQTNCCSLTQLQSQPY